MASILTLIVALFVIQFIVSRVLLAMGFRDWAVRLSMLGTWLTFPGVILRELSHKIFCDLAGVPVVEARYLQFKYPAGYVMHEPVSRYRDAFLLTAGPFLVNTAFAVAAFAPVCFGIGGIPMIALVWLGVSFAANAFPADADARGLWRQSERAVTGRPIAAIGLPVVIFVTACEKLSGYIRIGLLYSFVLYSVTFCLLAAILIAGSFALPGVYAVEVTQPILDTPAITIHNPFTYGHPLPAIPKPTPIKTVAGREAPAKDWLPVANAAMEKENSDAILIYVHGYSSERGTTLPINGKCHRWWYQYAVPADEIVYDVYVHDGMLESVREGTFENHGLARILCKSGNPRIESWTLDSTDASAIANAEIMNRVGYQPPSCAYVLEVSSGPINKGNLTWSVCYYKSDGYVQGDVDIDHDTGVIVR